MKRKIVFRGKSKRNGEWLYGDLEYNRQKDIARIHTYNKDGMYEGQKIVDAETVGQFTGLFDKNGKEIYEGDIIRVNPTDSGIRYVKWDGKYAQFVSQMLHNEQYYLISHNDSQVIGNVHDNPDLLKGGER